MTGCCTRWRARAPPVHAASPAPACSRAMAGWWRARSRKVWSAAGRIPEPKPRAATVMAALLGVLLAAAAVDGADGEALQRLWAGGRDSRAQAGTRPQGDATGWPPK